MTLHSHSEKHERGSIILQLSIKAVGGTIPVTVCTIDQRTQKNAFHHIMLFIYSTDVSCCLRSSATHSCTGGPVHKGGGTAH